MGAMKFRILGTLEVGSSGDGMIPLGPPQQRALLAMLIIHANHTVTVEALIDGLWPVDPPKSAPNLIQGYVSRLRRVLGDGSLSTRPAGYALGVSDVEIDAMRFERCVDRALRNGMDDAAKTATLNKALAMWRGPALADFASEHFAQAEIARLEQLRRRALEARVESDLSLGCHDDLVPELQSLVKDDPLYERAWEYLTVALYRAGRQADALAAYEDARVVLSEELGLDPGPELQRLQQQILTQDPKLQAPPRAVAPEPRHNLPAQLTTFVGRDMELQEITALLEHNRLMTLTGVGGGGKTRLALEVATRCVGDFKDGAWFVDLASLADPSLVPQAVSTCFDLRDEHGRSLTDTLVDFLLHKHALIVLDNCEHLIEACAELATVLVASCAELHVLATSREALAVHGEIVWPVPTLSLPDPGVSDPGAVLDSESAEMFVARTRQVLPGFNLDEDNAPTVAAVCSRLEGIPLCIELAAARMKTLSAEDILARLDDRFELLSRWSRTAPPRHRTLRSTIDWSYDLLSEGERSLFDRLSMLPDGFDLDAVQGVAGKGTSDDVLSLLSNLVDKSLVQREPAKDGTARFALLETHRQYGAERLDALGERNR